MFVSLRRTQTWRLHTKLYKFGWHTSANNARMKNSRDLILGEVAYISIYRIPDSWLDSLNGFDSWFWWHDWWKPRINSAYRMKNLSAWRDKVTVLLFSDESSRVRYIVIVPLTVAAESSLSALLTTICNGNRTEWSLIRSAIIRLITKSDDHEAGVRFIHHKYDYRPNWTTRSLIIN